MECPPSTPMSEAMRPDLADPLDIGRRAGQLEHVGVARDHPVHEVDLFKRRADGGLPLVGDRNVHRPELSSDAAGPKPRNVRHQ